MSRPPTLAQSQAKSRHHFQVATFWRLTHVATSNWCRDIAQSTPGRDLQTGSRHRFSCSAPKPGRDFIFPSRDLLELHLCRDIVSMSRHCFHVATSFLPIVGLLGRDTEIHVVTSHTAAHVATSNPCRDAVFAQPKQTRSRRHFLVATSRCSSRLPSCRNQGQPVSASTKPGRDLKPGSRPNTGIWQ